MKDAPIILASGSSSRRLMLEAAGVAFTSVPSGIDEDALKEAMVVDGMTPGEIADALAEAKALDVSARHPGALVLGADQVLVCRGRMFSKCMSETEARETLSALRGRQHELISAAVIARDGKAVWRHSENAFLTMRDFSERFLDEYLGAELPDALGSVGVYRIEGRGAQLFSDVAGDQFCIRGLPLLAVLTALRDMGALPQ